MTQTPAQIAATYFEAWKAKDFDNLASILHEDATFRGPHSARPTAAKNASPG
nr:DUF4440 domain-containing protein [Rhodococcus sp. (in: high G+C Gram-positive bacteria)]